MTVPRLIRRAGFVLTLVLAAFTVPFATPIGVAQACGCGAFEPVRGRTATVPAETALVRSVGGYEDIYLSLSVNSDARTGALLFPVPDKHPVVSAGPRQLFDHLATFTAPAVPAGPHSLADAGAPAPRPNIVVEKRQAIGPLEVVTLTVDADGSAGPEGGAVLTRWLTRNGFSAKPALAAAAMPYVARGWAFVAVRLRPAVSASSLEGELDPLHLRFRSSQTVYPMRLSHLSPRPEYVTVYTLGAHPLTLDTRDPGMRLEWAQRLTSAPYPELEPLMHGGARVLTRYAGTLQPMTIHDDFRFTPDPTDRSLITGPNQHYATERNLPPVDTSDHTTAIIALAAFGVVLLAALVVCSVVIARRRNAEVPG